MTCDEKPNPIALAHRWSAGIDVTLLWTQHHPLNEMVVCVFDQQDGAYFEITPEPHLALDVYPFFYRDFSPLDYRDSRLAASSATATMSHGRVRVGP